MYNKIKKEHVFIFLILFSALVIINYFVPGAYTSYTTAETCSNQGYECCSINEGEGVYHFSLDRTCSKSKECWDSCPAEINEITGNAAAGDVGSFLSGIWSSIASIFKKEAVGGFTSGCPSNQRLFKVSDFGDGNEGGFHAGNLNSDYPNYVCAPEGLTNDGTAELIKLSSADNAHVQSPEYSDYPNTVYISSTDCQIIFQNECDPGYECIFEISDLTNAHVKDCGSNYDYQVCCSVEEDLGYPDNSPPTITLISPLGAAASVSINPTLTWDGYDADGDNIFYILSLKESTSGTWGAYETLDETTYTVQNLEFNTAYDWKVSANDGTSTVVSNQRTFTTEEYNPEPCSNDGSETQDCPTGDQGCPIGSQTRTCNNGVWSNWGSCIMDADNCEGANPIIQIDPTIISFESEVNIPQDQLFTISNTGDETLIIYDITLSERNYLSSDPPFEVITNIKVNNVPLDRSGFTYSLAQQLTIAPGSSKTVVLTFTPDAFGNAGTYDGKVYIYHSDEVHFNSHEGNDYISYVAYHGQGVENIEPFCGDGSIDSGEECDTANLGSQTCSLLGFNGGDLLCTDTCQLDTSSCHSSEICDNGNPLTDSNGNGIISAFECSNYDYSLSIDEITPMDENVYSYAYTSFDCEYGINQNVAIPYHEGARNCLEGVIFNGADNLEYACETKRLISNKVRFGDCYVGSSAGTSTEICRVSEVCNSGENSREIFDLEVEDYSYCAEPGEIETLIDIKNIQISNDNEPGEIVDVSGEIDALLDQDETIVVSSALINLNTGSIIAEDETQIEYNFEDSNGEEFELELLIPNSIDDGKYYIFTKAYILNQEDSSCRQDMYGIPKEIEGNDEGIDEDNDGYFDYEDCNDNDGLVNPGSQESCNDFLDNDCDDLIDNEDPDCAVACSTGQTRACSTGLNGICSEGTQTCDNEMWGLCEQTAEPRQEVCSDFTDNNCNGVVDENCGSSGITDTDNDGLPDQWEMQYFGNLFQGPNDDFDNDSYSNIEEWNRETDPTNERSGPVEGANLAWLWILLIIIFVAVILLVFRRNIGNLFKKRSKGSDVDPRLRSYISSSLAKGFTKQQIKQALISKGWSQKDIDKALR